VSFERGILPVEASVEKERRRGNNCKGQDSNKSHYQVGHRRSGQSCMEVVCEAVLKEGKESNAKLKPIPKTISMVQIPSPVPVSCRKFR
jgi:hypothetical protein